MSLLRHLIKRAREEWLRRCLDLSRAAGQDAAGRGLTVSTMDSTTTTPTSNFRKASPTGGFGSQVPPGVSSGRGATAPGGRSGSAGSPAYHFPFRQGGGAAKKWRCRSKRYSPSPPTLSLLTALVVSLSISVVRLAAGWGMYPPEEESHCR